MGEGGGGFGRSKKKCFHYPLNVWISSYNNNGLPTCSSRMSRGVTSPLPVASPLDATRRAISWTALSINTSAGHCPLSACETTQGN